MSRLVILEAKKMEKPSGVAAHFIVPLEDKNVTEDENVTFTCKVAGDPTPEVQW